MQFARTPTGFIPEQDQGYLITVVQLPPGATLDRTEAVVKKAIEIILGTPGIEHVAPFAGLDATTFTVASNAGTIFSGLPSLYNHDVEGVTATSVLADLRKRLSVIQDAYVLTIPPPPVQGLGNAGGFKMMLQDQRRARLRRARQGGAGAGRRRQQGSAPSPACSPCSAPRSPSVYADIDRVKAEKVGLTPTDVFSTLQVYLGSQYVNDFNYLGRTYPGHRPGRWPVPADRRRHLAPQGPQRVGRDGADRHGGPAAAPRPPPIACRATISSPRPRSRAWRRPASRPAVRCSGWRNSPTRSCRPASVSSGPSSPSSSSSTARPTLLVFGAAALFVFLVLAAQYESWKLPLAVVLIVPMCLLASVTGLSLRGMPIDVLAQIGFVVLVGLAAKNAILIVEFARQAEDEGEYGCRSCGPCGAHAAAPDPDDFASPSSSASHRSWSRPVRGRRCASRSAPPCSSACWA